MVDVDNTSPGAMLKNLESTGIGMHYSHGPLSTRLEGMAKGEAVTFGHPPVPSRGGQRARTLLVCPQKGSAAGLSLCPHPDCGQCVSNSSQISERSDPHEPGILSFLLLSHP